MHHVLTSKSSRCSAIILAAAALCALFALVATSGWYQQFGSLPVLRWTASVARNCQFVATKSGNVILASDRSLIVLNGTTGREIRRIVVPDTISQISQVNGQSVYITAGKRLYAVSENSGSFRSVLSQKERLINLNVCSGHVVCSTNSCVTVVGNRSGQAIWTRAIGPVDIDESHSRDWRVLLACGGERVCVLSAGNNTVLQALSIMDGRPIWRRSLDSGFVSQVVTNSSSLVTARVVGATTHIEVFDAHTGNRRWERSLPEEYPVVLTIGEDGLVFVADWVGHVTALDERSGVECWSRDLDAKVGMPPVLGGASSLYVGSGPDRVTALDRKTGRIQWSTGLQSGIERYLREVPYSRVVCGPGNWVYLSSTSGRIYGLVPPSR